MASGALAGILAHQPSEAVSRWGDRRSDDTCLRTTQAGSVSTRMGSPRMQDGLIGTCRPPLSSRKPCGATKGNLAADRSVLRGHSRRTRDARPTTSSSSRSRPARTRSGGGRSTSRSPRPHYDALREKVVDAPVVRRPLRRRRQYRCRRALPGPAARRQREGVGRAVRPQHVHRPGAERGRATTSRSSPCCTRRA